MKKFRFLVILALIIPIVFTFVGCKKKKTENISNSTTYYISYVLNGGTNNSKNPNSYTSDGANVSLSDPERKGYNFLGWYTNANFTGRIETISANTGKNLILYAGWTPRTFSVTFEYNGATIKNGNNSKDITFGSKFGTLPVPEKYGDNATYEFLGWYYGNSKIDENTIYSYFADVTINARWKENIIPKETYNVNFNSKGGSDVANQEVTEGDTLVKPSNPEREGYTFGGWFIDGEEWDFEQVVTGHMTLTAKWNIVTYNIIYHTGNGENSENNPDTYTIEDDDIELEDPVLIGHTFGGWFRNNSYTRPIEVIEKGSHEEINLYAKWTANTYKVTFDYDGATDKNSEETRYIVYGKTIGELPSPEKQIGDTKFEFLWWQLVLENSSEIVIISKDTVYDFVKDITIVAIWKEINNPVYFNVSFDSDGGTEITSQSVEQGTFAVQPENNPEKRGYNFDKWVRGGIEWKFDENPVYEDITLTAVYIAIEYDIHYELDDGINNDKNPVKYTISENDIVLFDPEKESYEFVGWFDGKGNKVTAIKAGEIGDKTFYASWNKIVLITVTIHYNIPELLMYEFKDYKDPNPQPVKVGTEYSLPKNNLTNSEFFDAFYTKDVNGVKHYILDSSIYISTGNDIVLYGEWKNEKINDIYSNVNLTFGNYYDENEEIIGAIVTGYTGNSSIVIIPKACSIDGHYRNILKIGDLCFANKIELSKVILNCSDIEIGNNAFDNTILQEIDFSKIRKIGDYAFRNTSLESITLGENIETISTGAFQDNKNLTSVDFSNLNSDISRISNKMFYNCKKLSNVLLNNSISQIGESAFENCQLIDDLDFAGIMSSMANSNVRIETKAFAGCTSLSEVEISEKVSYVGINIFDNCGEGLVKITLSNFYRNNSSQTFRDVFGDNGIKEVIITGTSTNIIPDGYFYYDDKICTIDMKNSGIKYFGKDAFLNCSNLENVTFSDVVDWGVFNLSAFNGTCWKDNFAEMIIYNDSLIYIPSTISEVIIPDGIISIGGNASSDNKTITSLEIPASVKVIGESAFSHCEKLQSVTFAKNSELTTIESKAFMACYKLGSINLSDCQLLDKIGNDAFKYMGYNFINSKNLDKSTFNQLRLPSNISYIGENAFAYSNIGQFDSKGIKYVSNSKGILFEKNESEDYIGLVAYPIAITDLVYELPKTVSKIYAGAIAQNKLSYIYIKSNVTIYVDAFAKNPNCVIIKESSDVSVTLDKTSGNPTEQYIINLVPEDKNEEYGISYGENDGGYWINISEEIVTQNNPNRNTKTFYLVTYEGEKYFVGYSKNNELNFVLRVTQLIS